MRAGLIWALIVILGLIVPGPAISDPALQWTMQQGWLVAHGGKADLIKHNPGSAAEIVVNDAPLSSKSPQIQTRPLPNRTIETVYSVKGLGTLIDRYEPFPSLGNNAWRRSLTYTNNSQATQDITGAVLRVCPAALPKADVWHPQVFWMGAVSPQTFACIAYHSNEDMYSMNVNSGVVESVVSAGWRLQPGQQARIGSQWIWLCKGGPEDYRPQAQKFYKSVGLRTTPDTPAWLPDSVYYKTCAGGTIQSRSSDIGGYDNFSHQLDYLADLGVNTIMYHSVNMHKTPPDPMKGGWNVYGIVDYSKIDPISGGADALRRLTTATKACGMHVFSELCLNGYYSSQAKTPEMKKWWTCYRDGKPVMSFGGASMDYSCPEWQAEMAACASRLAREFGVEGMRLDLGSGSGDNWTSPKSNHTSYSFLGGSLEMLKAVSNGARVSKSCPVLISEDLIHQPERYTTTPLLYGFQQKQLLSMGLPADLANAPEIRKRLFNFFETERGSLPDGGLVIRTLGGLNEVVEWGRPQVRFGTGLTRALYGVMLSVPGVVQMVQEEEVGSFEAIRRLNWAHRRVPEMLTGEPDYRSISFAPEVFTVIRSIGNSHALALVNLSGKLIQGKAVLPGYMRTAEGTRVYDAVSGRETSVQKNTIKWILKPYETAILRIGNPPIGQTSPIRFTGEPIAVPAEKEPFNVQMNDGTLTLRAGQIIGQLITNQGEWKLINTQGNLTTYQCPTGTLTLERDAGGGNITLNTTTGSTQSPTLRFFNADKWYVSGRTALLEDRVMRRHFPFPEGVDYHWDRKMTWGKEAGGMLYNGVFPTGRLWQSILEPLSPTRPGIGFEDRTGTAVVLSKISSSASNIVLTDRTDEAFQGPYGLDLRFYGVDPDLSPRVPLFGIDNVWTLPTYPKSSSGAQRLSFRISSPVNGAAQALDTPRLPVNKYHSEIARQGESFVFSEGALFYSKTGKVTWAIPSTLKGKYRIKLLLRYNTYDPDIRDMQPHYRVSIDGKESGIEWTEFNTTRIDTARFGTALTPSIDLDGRPHTLTIETTMDWCAVRFPMVLVPEGSQ